MYAGKTLPLCSFGTVTINEWMRECFKLVISVHDGTVKLKIITLSIIFRPGTSSSPPMTIGAPLNFPIEPQVYLKLCEFIPFEF